MFDLKRRWCILLPFTVACAAPPAGGAADEVAWRLNDNVGGVVDVSWSSAEAARVRVEYGPDTSYGRTTPLSEVAATAQEITVIGFAPDSEWHFRVVTVTDAGESPGPDHVVETAEAEDGLPEIELLATDGTAWGEWTLAAYGWSDVPQTGVVVLDENAQIVWHVQRDGTFIPWVELTEDNKKAVFLVGDEGRMGEYVVAYVGLDGRGYQAFPTTHAHHAMTQPEIPGVRFAYVSWVLDEWEGEPVVGDRIVEQAEDGTEREIWNAFDHLPVARHDGWEFGLYEQGADWTHANGLYYDTADDSYVVSLYWTDTLYKIDRETGETIWQFGGADSDFTLVDDEGFSRQHAPEIHGNRLYLFDNGTTPSRAVEYELDTTNWTATKVWEWATPEEGQAGVLGDVDVLPDDQMLTGWGNLGQVNVTGLDGTVHWRADAEPGVVIGKAQRFESFYP
ncbi:MAG: aryl-sulfate sulfotransferase [Pseudomonadota bacterium]|nr:aryl-sulfate sulfotransferase [Pseudomonadota bacterium]